MRSSDRLVSWNRVSPRSIALLSRSLAEAESEPPLSPPQAVRPADKKTVTASRLSFIFHTMYTPQKIRLFGSVVEHNVIVADDRDLNHDTSLHLVLKVIRIEFNVTSLFKPSVAL